MTWNRKAEEKPTTFCQMVLNKIWKNFSRFHNCEESKIIPNFKVSKFHKKLLEAAESNDIMFIKQNSWMMRSSDLNCTDQNGNTPLYIAVSNNNLQYVKYLLGLGANINLQNENGNTVLHKAIIMGDFRMITMLVQMKADKSIKNKWNLTPLEWWNTKLLRQLQLTQLGDWFNDNSSDESDLSRDTQEFLK